MSTETPFKIDIPESSIELLHKKLDLAVFSDELPDSGWKYGVPLADVKRLTARWRNGFSWSEHEAQLNAELPQFTCNIAVEGHGTLNIHYVHKKSSGKNAIPLLFVHGWPGSFLEVRKILPLLTNNDGTGPTFDVVAPSLPGFGFSDAPKQQGFAGLQYAETFHKLMLALGYDEYVTQGGDWGHTVTRLIAEKYGHTHSKAWHTNFVQQVFPPTLLSQPDLYLSDSLSPHSEFEKAAFERMDWFTQQGTGYHQQQGTAPQTLGYSLADSPVGLLAWIYEKLHNWTDEYPWQDDEVLEWISIFWFSKAGPTASLRIYFETYQARLATSSTGFSSVPTTIPMGMSFFPKELRHARPSWIRASIGNLIFYKYHDNGGHFAAHERPEDLAQDVKEMFGKGGPAYGVVPGKDGYA